MAQGSSKKTIAQRRAKNVIKNDFNIEFYNAEFDALDSADDAAMDKIDKVYVGESKYLIDDNAKHAAVVNEKWTTDKDEAIKQAKKFDEIGGGVVITIDFNDKDMKKYKKCFTKIPDKEIIARAIKTSDDTEKHLHEIQSEVDKILDESNTVIMLQPNYQETIPTCRIPLDKIKKKNENLYRV